MEIVWMLVRISIHCFSLLHVFLWCCFTRSFKQLLSLGVFVWIDFCCCINLYTYMHVCVCMCLRVFVSASLSFFFSCCYFCFLFLNSVSVFFTSSFLVIGCCKFFFFCMELNKLYTDRTWLHFFLSLFHLIFRISVFCSLVFVWFNEWWWWWMVWIFNDKMLMKRINIRIITM